MRVRLLRDEIRWTNLERQQEPLDKKKLGMGLNRHQATRGASGLALLPESASGFIHGYWRLKHQLGTRACPS